MPGLKVELTPETPKGRQTTLLILEKRVYTNTRTIGLLKIKVVRMRRRIVFGMMAQTKLDNCLVMEMCTYTTLMKKLSAEWNREHL